MDQKHTSPAGSELDSLKETVQNLSTANAQLAAENAELRRKLERMNELLLLAQRARFGQSSEKREYVMQGGDQLQLFNEAEACQNLKEPEPTEETIVFQYVQPLLSTYGSRYGSKRNGPLKSGPKSTENKEKPLISCEISGDLVAGAGFEPTTFGL